MTRLIIAALLIFMSLRANADDPNARAEREARGWLKPCRETVRQAQQLCLLNQRNFIEQYVYAKAGDLSAMGSTSASFRASGRRDDTASIDRLGAPQDLVQSCAWQGVRVMSTRGEAYSERAALRSICLPLSPNEVITADERVEQLLRELRTAPARAPRIGWEPRVAGLAPSPTGPFDPKCLDGTACVPGTECKPFIPPKGCPAPR